MAEKFTVREGLDSSIVPATPRDLVDYDQRCGICLEEFGHSSSTALDFACSASSKLPCGHVFGRRCVIEWINRQLASSRQPKCPFRCHVGILTLLTTSDGGHLYVLRQVIEMSATIDSLLGREHIPTLPVNTAVMRKVMQWCVDWARHGGHGDWVQQIFTNITEDTFVGLFRAAHYLRVESLLRVCSEKVARLVLCSFLPSMLRSILGELPPQLRFMVYDYVIQRHIPERLHLSPCLAAGDGARHWRNSVLPYQSMFPIPFSNEFADRVLVRTEHVSACICHAFDPSRCQIDVPLQLARHVRRITWFCDLALDSSRLPNAVQSLFQIMLDLGFRGRLVLENGTMRHLLWMKNGILDAQSRVRAGYGVEEVLNSMGSQFHNENGHGDGTQAQTTPASTAFEVDFERSA